MEILWTKAVKFSQHNCNSKNNSEKYWVITIPLLWTYGGGRDQITLCT